MFHVVTFMLFFRTHSLKMMPTAFWSAGFIVLPIEPSVKFRCNCCTPAALALPGGLLEHRGCSSSWVWLHPTFVLLGTLLHGHLRPGIASLSISHFSFPPSGARSEPKVQCSARQVSVEVFWGFCCFGLVWFLPFFDLCVLHDRFGNGHGWI